MKRSLLNPKRTFGDFQLTDRPDASQTVIIPLEDGTKPEVRLISRQFDEKSQNYSFVGSAHIIGQVRGECSQDTGWLVEDRAEGPKSD